MNNFGTLKIKILNHLTESYIAGKKDQIKKTLKLLKENKDFRELYLFYEEIEGKTLEDKDLAKLYVEEIEDLLMEKTKAVKKYCTNLKKQFENESVDKVELYNYLDILSEKNSFKNVDKKILAKKNLVEHLTKKKKITESTNVYTNNERLLHFVLADRFNNDFEKMLSEEEKMKLSEILSMTPETLKNEFTTLKENVTKKLTSLMLESDDQNIIDKLGQALAESKEMPITKFNYYKLQQLENGL